MMSNPITIQVLAFGELYQLMLNALAGFMNQGFFASFLKLTALIGIIMVTVGYLKRRDPTIYAKWVVSYVLVLQLLITPKTDVMVYDIAEQKGLAVDNVPLVFAVTASILTNIGVGLAETYDALLSLPDDLKYTKTGSLFGSKLIQGAHDFRILDPVLKQEMNEYFKNCVVGDIQINHKYSVGDLGQSNNIYALISKEPSPIRLTTMSGQKLSCIQATKILKPKFDAEIKKAYQIFGIQLFHHAKSNYEVLFEEQLQSSFAYFQQMTDSSADIFLQSMMINAMGDGLKDYQAFTDSTAGIINNQVTKSEVQHRFAWAVAGEKAAWFLPILHSVLLVMLFAIFPIILVMTTLPNGVQIFKGYMQFFISLQFWPVLFAILNSVMTCYGHKSQGYGALTMVSIEKMDEFHADLTGVAGYLMLMIPFLAKGLISNLSEAFNNLATSMTNHLQGSAMSVANDVASSSFSFGQNSFYNTNANNFSANKHDSNWSNFHGMRTEQLATGVTRTQTASGDTVFDVGAGISKGVVSIHGTEGLMSNLHESYEKSKQASRNAHQAYQEALTQSAHHASQLSQLSGHDMRLGEGVSEGETTHFQKSLSKMKQIASDVAERTGVSQDEAMTALFAAHIEGKAHLPKIATTPLKIVSKGRLEASGTIGGNYSRSSNSSDNAKISFDEGVTTREAKDFNESYNQVKQFVKNHHFDETTSRGAQLSSQLGDDIRKAETASQNYDISLAQSERISRAESYVKSHGDQINANLDQSFAQFVASKVGSKHQQELYANPGSMSAISELNQLGDVFLQGKRDEIIAQFGGEQKSKNIEDSYQSQQNLVHQRKDEMLKNYQAEEKQIKEDAKPLNLNFNEKERDALYRNIDKHSIDAHYSLQEDKIDVNNKKNNFENKTKENIDLGKENATRWLTLRKKDFFKEKNDA
jgi:conjugal transfer mating pair stabilization protein TraG